jgi:hypothetical protein
VLSLSTRVGGLECRAWLLEIHTFPTPLSGRQRSPITVAKWPLIDSLLKPADYEIILLGALQEVP